jgi:hypothetical protein
MAKHESKSSNTTNANVYVGYERYTDILQHAIDVSADTRVQVTPSQFVQHLVDHYSLIARENWLKTLAKGNEKKLM